MLDTRVARRYAQALFNTAEKYDVVRSVESDLATIVGLLTSNSEFKEFLNSPTTGRDEKVAFAERVFGEKVTALTMQLLRVMLDKQRESELPLVRDEFIKMRREKEGVVHAVVTSSDPLDESQRSQIVTKLSAVLGKTVEPTFETDASLLGGVRVSYENNVLDGSVKGALGRLREKLRYDLLKQA